MFDSLSSLRLASVYQMQSQGEGCLICREPFFDEEIAGKSTTDCTGVVFSKRAVYSTECEKPHCADASCYLAYLESLPENPDKFNCPLCRREVKEKASTIQYLQSLSAINDKAVEISGLLDKYKNDQCANVEFSSLIGLVKKFQPPVELLNEDVELKKLFLNARYSLGLFFLERARTSPCERDYDDAYAMLTSCENYQMEGAGELMEELKEINVRMMLKSAEEHPANTLALYLRLEALHESNPDNEFILQSFAEISYLKGLFLYRRNDGREIDMKHCFKFAHDNGLEKADPFLSEYYMKDIKRQCGSGRCDLHSIENLFGNIRFVKEYGREKDKVALNKLIQQGLLKTQGGSILEKATKCIADQTLRQQDVYGKLFMVQLLSLHGSEQQRNRAQEFMAANVEAFTTQGLHQ